VQSLQCLFGSALPVGNFVIRESRLPGPPATAIARLATRPMRMKARACRVFVEYLLQLIDGEAASRENRSIERRFKKARLPALSSLTTASGPQVGNAAQSLQPQCLEPCLRVGVLKGDVQARV